MTRLADMTDGDWAFAEQQHWMDERLHDDTERDDLLPYFGPEDNE